MNRLRTILFFGTCGIALFAQGQVSGRVMDSEGPVPFAHVVVQGTSHGAVTDLEGRFQLSELPSGSLALHISAIGHTARTVSLEVSGPTQMGSIHLQRVAAELEEVVVTGTLKEVSRADSPVPVEVVTPMLFRKNPEPSLLGSIGMVNGVRPQLNCSVCNTGDIHINGMEGPYTMVLIDGMPIVSGLGTVYGLSGIPNSMVERIEVVKGPAGALYGSEAMGGIINVITRDPTTAPRVAADAFTTSWNERNLDLGATLGNGKLRSLLSVNGYHYDDPRDGNNDGFTDLTIQERVSVFGKVGLQRNMDRKASIAARYIHEDRWGGQMHWTPAFLGSDSIYGESIATRRWEVIGQYQLPFVERVMAQFSINGHHQDSWYGNTPFLAEQRVAFGQLTWDRKLGAQHDLLAGAATRFTFYNDGTPGTSDAFGRDRPERTLLPGLFLQDEWRFAPAQTLLLGLRADHHPKHGVVPSPRIAYRWSPNEKQTFRASLGSGFRVVNLFTEEHAALTGARNVVLVEDLRPERSVGATLNYTRRWNTATHTASLDATMFHTRFSNRIIGDFDTDPNTIFFTNLDGHAVTQGISLNGDMNIGGPWRAMCGVSWMDVYQVRSNENSVRDRIQQLYAPQWSGVFTLGHRAGAWTTDLTGNWTGPMRLPVQHADPRPGYSPWYAILNLQVTRKLGSGFEVYGGAKNLLGFVPDAPILRSFDPFDTAVDDPVANPNGHTFDTAYMYAPLQGLRAFFGLRWVL